jgi:sulfofructose kinase
MTAELVCVGSATLDTVVELPHWPQPDGRVVIGALIRAGGGQAVTAAVAAARLGRSVSVVSRVGRDVPGREIRKELIGEGVDVAHLDEGDERTAESVILVDRRAATRAILHAEGPALAPLAPAAREACMASDWVHVDHAGWPAVADVPRSRISVDAGNPIPALALDGLGLYSPNAPALRERYPGLSLSGAVERALGEGAQRVVVTLGGEGAVAADRAGAWRVAGVPIAAVSTLGAGDVFHGTFLALLIEGRSMPEALRAANVAAALSCMALGSRDAIPVREELERALVGSPPVVSLALETHA